MIGLTPRQAQIAILLKRGLSNQEMAGCLDLKEVTVKLHMRGLCKRLNVKTRTQAVIVLIRAEYADKERRARRENAKCQ